MIQISTILIVDDEPAGQYTLETLLVNQGYQLAFARDGSEALTKAVELTPDVILLDVMMPDMDGFEVCRRLRADPLLAEVPVLMVTALDDHDSRLAGIEAGADDFISKPFNRLELRARIQTITRLNRYRRLQTERARFEWVIEQADEGYLVVNEQDEILYLNPKARFFLDLPVDNMPPAVRSFLTLIGKHYHLQPPEAWTTWPAATNEAATPRYLVRPESPEANAFWLQVDLFEGPAGPDIGRIIRLRDVTELMALQCDIWGFHELISHKFRTPLTGILGSLELLIKHSSKLSLAEITKFVQTAFANAQRLHNDIQDILEYIHAPGFIEPGAGFKLGQLPMLVAQICGDLALESASVTILEDLNESRISFSQQNMELVLREILENAKKFHPNQSPAVTITVSRLSSHQVCLQICDDGRTLSPDQLARVWRPYYQGEKQFTGEAAGMGLGLSMVGTLTWAAGGSCGLYNRIDEPGIAVELTLPIEIVQK